MLCKKYNEEKFKYLCNYKHMGAYMQCLKSTMTVDVRKSL